MKIMLMKLWSPSWDIFKQRICRMMMMMMMMMMIWSGVSESGVFESWRLPFHSQQERASSPESLSGLMKGSRWEGLWWSGSPPPSDPSISMETALPSGSPHRRTPDESHCSSSSIDQETLQPAASRWFHKMSSLSLLTRSHAVIILA